MSLAGSVPLRTSFGFITSATALGRERREDLVILCKSCHDGWHATKNRQANEERRRASIDQMVASWAEEDARREERQRRAEYDAYAWWYQQIEDWLDEDA